ncbi:hypothetical protein ACFSQ7_00900 [Paenibacillus rhizoplanae]
MNNLHEAWLSVKKNQGSGGVDGVSIEMYEKNLHINLRELQRLLQQGRYVPDPVRRRYIEKENGKLRPLGIPTVRDRICQQAVRQIIEPIFEEDFFTIIALVFGQDTRRIKPYGLFGEPNETDMNMW